MAGIFGINLNKSCWSELKRGLKHLQPIRGDKYAGFSILAGGEIYTEKGEGTIERLFGRELTENSQIKKGQIAIGGVSFQDTQPIFAEESRIGPFALTGDVKIINKKEVIKEFPYLVGSDIRVCAGLIGGGKNPVEGLKRVFDKVKGRYNLALLTSEGLFACRDTWGFRSLVIGRNENGCCAVASESATIGTTFGEAESEIIREVKPGEIIQIETTGFNSLEKISSKGLVICPFDIGYGQGPASIFEEISIGLARFNMGRKLAQKYGVESDIVFSFPLSGNTAGEGYAFESRLPFVNIWQYNPLGRSYLPISEEERKERGKSKLSPIEWVIRDFKKFVGVDDSIVEGNQLISRLFLLLKLMRKYHSSTEKCELHLRIACPPKIKSCPLEVPFRPTNKLFAAARSKKTMTGELRVESLEFNTLDDFIDAILTAQDGESKKKNPLKPENLCSCCFTGKDLISKYFE